MAMAVYDLVYEYSEVTLSRVPNGKLSSEPVSRYAGR